MPKSSSEYLRSNTSAVLPQCEEVGLSSLSPPPAVLRVHSGAKMRTLTRSIQKLGLMSPIIINSKGVIIDGNARVGAARKLGWTTITAIRVLHATDEDLRVYAVAANKLAADVTWDFNALRLELEALESAVPDIDLTLTGFSIPEIDTMRGAYAAATLNDLVDDIPPPLSGSAPVSQVGDLWNLKGHRALCGDATDPAVLATLMEDAFADQVLTDPPYGVPINGHVSGNGKVRHREFVMGSANMSPAQLRDLLKQSLHASAAHLADGGLAYVFMDHAHIDQLIEAGAEVFAERKAICVWDKGQGAMGSLYRNAYELVAVFKKGRANHINNVQLGKHGRNRTTIWRYPGIAQQGKGRAKALSLHPTVKPVALIADAILDASSRGGIVLDPFGGSGTTMIAAEVTGRRARLVELDPAYVDIIIARFEQLTGSEAVHAATGLTFAQMREQRAPMRSPLIDDAVGGRHE